MAPEPLRALQGGDACPDQSEANVLVRPRQLLAKSPRDNQPQEVTFEC